MAPKTKNTRRFSELVFRAIRHMSDSLYARMNWNGGEKSRGRLGAKMRNGDI